MEMTNVFSSMNVEVATPQKKSASSVGVTRTTGLNSKKRKRLQYNFKEISSQILTAKTSNIAGTVAIRARAKVAVLLSQKRTGEYDDTEVEHAIIHAKRMARVARKRTKHLKEEEMAKSGNSYGGLEENEAIEDGDEEQQLKESEEELKELQEEYQELMRESMDDMADLDDLEDELMEIVQVDMKPEDLERLKKKHRSEELRDIMEADAKYLKALMDKLQKEKQEGSSGISLQLSGMEVPIDAPVTETAPVEAEGGSIDISL